MLALLLSLVAYWVMLHSSHTQMRDQIRTDTHRLTNQTDQALALQIDTVVKTLDYFSQHLSWTWLQSNTHAFKDAVSVAMHSK